LDEGGRFTAALLAGRPFHFAYESNLLKGLLVADLPATMLAIPLGLVMTPLLKVLNVGFFTGRSGVHICLRRVS
jgi:hypothetical protein